LSYRKRISMLILIDMIIIWLSIYCSYLFRFDGIIPSPYQRQWMYYGLISVFVCITILYSMKLYNRIWQYASVGEMIAIAKAVVIGSVFSYIISLVFFDSRVPISIFIHVVESMLLLIGGSRFAWRIVRDKYVNKSSSEYKAIIVGAGDCGALIVKELRNHSQLLINPIGFIDDNPNKQNMQILGLNVLGNQSDIPDIVQKHKVSEIIIAIPSASKLEISNIIHISKATGAKLKIIPRINDLIEGKVSLNLIRDVEVEDLLGRDQVEIQLELVADYIHDKVVLVTGAGGSIGSELCRQIAPFLPSKLLLLGHGENSIYQIHKELTTSYPNLHTESIIADVQDRKRMMKIFEQYRPELVFHAAAHKHVPLMEMNPSEAIKNNVFGTKNVAECADLYGTDRFVLISSDKAVNPTSIMGATKRIAEKFIQNLDKQSKTIFSAVRFGNVLGSSGSVIPLFKEQIARGGPVTVTDPEMIRYFMTIPEASRLVIQSGAFAKGGEIFILDMGQPVRIVDLAADLIRLSGYEPNEDIEIQYTGIRQGEKLFEELLTNEEGLTSTKHDRIFIGLPTDMDRVKLDFELRKLEKAIGEDQVSIRNILQRIVPTYVNQGIRNINIREHSSV
jgi:FlaA1/EpsC-like NDP-sugar epimerase